MLFIIIPTVSFVIWAVKVRNNFAATLKKTSQSVPSIVVDNSVGPDKSGLNINDLNASDGGVLGLSDSGPTISNNDNSGPIPTPFPIFTLVPIQTYTPQSSTTTNTNTNTATSSTTSCAGTPTAYNSEAIVSSSSTQINNAVNISIQLLDCNNNYGPVDDTLTVTLSNSDASARINGSSSPISVKAQNGQVSVSVNSQNAGTDTFVIHDVTRNFDVTDPHNHNPSVTFTTNSTGNSSCTTAAGVPNSWYSDVYPASPISSNTGSAVTFTIAIRDCFKNNISSNDSLSITLSSGDSGTQVNGNNLPYTLTTQNGQGSFNVVSQNSGTVALVVQDTTSSFTVTDTNNNNPSVIFSSSSSPTPTPTTPTTAPTQTPVPAATATPPVPTPTTVTVSPTGVPSASPTP